MKKDGGPAFPYPDTASNGMSLRDYSAAQALNFLSMSRLHDDRQSLAHDRGVLYPALLAEEAYAIADAMLRARE